MRVDSKKESASVEKDELVHRYRNAKAERYGLSRLNGIYDKELAEAAYYMVEAGLRQIPPFL